MDEKAIILFSTMLLTIQESWKDDHQNHGAKKWFSGWQPKKLLLTAQSWKEELLQMAYAEKGKHDRLVIDEEAKKANKTVLGIPSYHCQLNPI